MLLQVIIYNMLTINHIFSTRGKDRVDYIFFKKRWCCCNRSELTKKDGKTNHYKSKRLLFNAAGKIVYCFVCQANHGGVRGKLPKDVEEEEAMEGTEDLDNSSDELVATPDDEVKEISNIAFLCTCVRKLKINCY